MSLVNFKTKFTHLDVLALSRYNNYILSGIGNDLIIYLNDTQVQSVPIFEGERIHAIHVKDDLALVKGGRALVLLSFLVTSDQLKCEKIGEIQINDWIQDVILYENQLAGLVTAHNSFQLWNLQSGQKINLSFTCEEKCILYSCKVIGSCVENTIIFAGTVFGVVVIWTPEEKYSLKRIHCHNGAVFSIEVQPVEKLLATTSDDRSLKVWSVTSKDSLSYPNQWKDSSIELIHTLFGHTARVWKSLILPNYYLTVSEDSQLILWNKRGGIINSLTLHQESGIRSLDFCTDSNLITTGGEDGGINSFYLNHLTHQTQAFKVLELRQNFSTKVCFVSNGFVYCLSGQCVVVSDGKEETIYENEIFASYCLSEVSPKDDYIALGSIKGHLIIIDSHTKTVLCEKQITNGRIFSIHWFNSFLVTCGPEGELEVWNFNDNILKSVNRMTLPNCKERWTTCAGIYFNELILGDRMGNLYVFDLYNGKNPTKTFRKIHSYLGVTDVFVSEGVLISVGRDGTMKEYSNEFALTKTSKLPMEWPWKIVRYKNDILILGFRSVSFIVWSISEREVIAKHDCGGGHRSCDFKIDKNILSFLYVKEKKVFSVDLTLDGVFRVRSGFHGKEINCLKVIQKNPLVFISGSEDTTLRVSIVEGTKLRNVEVLKTHTSSIRDVCVLGDIFVSAGGKGQLVIWSVGISPPKCKELVNHKLKKKTRNWKSTSIETDPETRIMSVDIVTVNNKLLIATGCSDCQIRIFLYKEDLQLLNVIPYTHCILKVNFLTTTVLVSMGTDGRVVFWDLRCIENPIGSFLLHQSGINSFRFEKLETGKYILGTGGDDNLISLALVMLGEKEVTLKRIWENKTTHSCQVTGLKILKNVLITTSIDQRITVWILRDNLIPEYFSQYISVVPDIQGIDAMWLDSKIILVTVYGKGIEVLQIKVEQHS